MHLWIVFVFKLQSIGSSLCRAICHFFVRHSVIVKAVKFGDPVLTRCREIRLSRRRSHFQRLFRDNFRMEVDSDVVSGMPIAAAGLGVCRKFGESRSNRS